jgi:hypothetical protein
MRGAISRPSHKSLKRVGNWSPPSVSNKKSQFKMSDSDLDVLLAMNVGRGNANSMSNSENDLRENDADLGSQSQNGVPSSQVPPNNSNSDPTNINEQDNDGQLELVGLLRQRSLLNQQIDDILARGVRLPSNTEQFNLAAFKTELNGKLRDTLSNVDYEFSAMLRDVPNFPKLPHRLEYYDELLALKTRLTDLLIRLKSGTLIQKADLGNRVNPAFMQLTNFSEVSARTNEIAFNLHYCQMGLITPPCSKRSKLELPKLNQH